MEKTSFTLRVMALLLLIPTLFIGSILHGSHNVSQPQNKSVLQQGASSNSGLVIENANDNRSI